MKKRVHVAVGVIVRDNEVFVSKRHDHLHQGGKWEFPGGKVEASESVMQALTRELSEELGITVEKAVPWMEIHHDYTDKDVLLDIYLVTDFAGEPSNLEGQDSLWASVNMLPKMEFPEANVAIIEQLKAHLPL